MDFNDYSDKSVYSVEVGPRYVDCEGPIFPRIAGLLFSEKEIDSPDSEKKFSCFSRNKVLE